MARSLKKGPFADQYLLDKVNEMNEKGDSEPCIEHALRRNLARNRSR